MKHEQALPGANSDSDHNILIAKTCSTLKKIINFQMAKPGWDLGELYSQKQKSARDTRRKTPCNWMWKWECGSAVKQYQEMCARSYEWLVGKDRLGKTKGEQ